MAYHRVLTVQDISCIGQCSLTVALPILSACGLETAVLPSAVLSTHTGGFSGYTFRDLTEDMPAIRQHWQKEGLTFSALYSGYLGSARQIEEVLTLADTLLEPKGVFVADPAMADNGKLYVGFDNAFVQEMARLCRRADFVLPNITEASLMTGLPYKAQYDEAYVQELLHALAASPQQTIVLTGVSFDSDTTGVMVYRDGKTDYYRHQKLAHSCHGTGDVYAAAFTGALVQGKSPFQSAQIAADYTVQCIAYTSADVSHWYGVKFEPLLPELIRQVTQ